MTVRRNWMPILNGISILQLVISNFAHAATATPINNMTYSRASKSPIRILSSDNLVVNAGTEFCITGYADKATIASVRRSGEEMMPWTVGAFANDTAIALNTALIDAGYPTSTIPSRVVIDSLSRSRNLVSTKPRPFSHRLTYSHYQDQAGIGSLYPQSRAHGSMLLGLTG
jgi:hypothetical protein